MRAAGTYVAAGFGVGVGVGAGVGVGSGAGVGVGADGVGGVVGGASTTATGVRPLSKLVINPGK